MQSGVDGRKLQGAGEAVMFKHVGRLPSGNTDEYCHQRGASACRAARDSARVLKASKEFFNRQQ